MKTTTKTFQIPKTTYSPRKKTLYVSDDGLKTSLVKKDIEQYEKEVERLKIRKQRFDAIKKILPGGEKDNQFYLNDDNYFKFNSYEEFKWVVDEYYQVSIPFDAKIFASGWMSIRHYDGGDYADSISVQYGDELVDTLTKQYKICKTILGKK